MFIVEYVHVLTKAQLSAVTLAQKQKNTDIYSVGKDSLGFWQKTIKHTNLKCKRLIKWAVWH